MLSFSIRKSISNDCVECASGNYIETFGDNCWLENRDGTDPRDIEMHNTTDKLLMKTILMSTAYAIACLFVRDGDVPA